MIATFWMWYFTIYIEYSCTLFEWIVVMEYLWNPTHRLLYFRTLCVILTGWMPVIFIFALCCYGCSLKWMRLCWSSLVAVTQDEMWHSKFDCAVLFSHLFMLMYYHLQWQNGAVTLSAVLQPSFMDFHYLCPALQHKRAASLKYQRNPTEWIILSVTVNNSVAVATHKDLLWRMILVKHIMELIRFYFNQHWDAVKLCTAIYVNTHK